MDNRPNELNRMESLTNPLASKFVSHRRIFCEKCLEETVWYPHIMFDTASSYEAVFVAECIECGTIKKTSMLSDYDKQMRYLHGVDSR